MIKRTLGIFLALVSFGAGCAGAKFTRTSNETYPSRDDNCDIQVYMTPPNQVYKELCLIEAKTSAGMFAAKDLGAMLPDIKTQACRCGADSVIIGNATRGNWATSTGGYATAVGVKMNAAKSSK
jgi:hypothetical protein